MTRPTTTILLSLFACGCATRTPTDVPPLYDGLGALRRPITTSSPRAQRYFDQGLILTYGFNHEEAVRAYRQAQRLDPDCAMAHWGEGLALGPNINAPLTDAAAVAAAHAATQRAYALRGQATPVERALIEALNQRYVVPQPADRSALDRAYADAMREVWRRFPDDADVGALFAEALLDTSPWNQWTKDGEPQPGTPEIVEVLEQTLARHPDHPGANHFYIHTVEASPRPERGLDAARRLAKLVPAAGHLVHMPAHIYIRTGRYAEAEEANRLALIADRAYFAGAGPQGMYEFYRAHNHHFLAYSAMFAGRANVALRSARDLIADLPDHAFTDAMAPFVDGFLAVPLHVLIRFGRWEDVLREPARDGPFPIYRAMRHYARGVAFAATDRVAQAREEQSLFATAAAAVSADGMIGINPAPPVLEVARHMLNGEILFREAKHDAAFAELREAVRCEEALRYDEPAGWMQPVRHALGALLLQVGRVADAELVYREDLARHAENGWALHGLAECLRRQGKTDEATAVGARFERAWTRADTQLRGSCFCRTAATGAGAARGETGDD